MWRFDRSALHDLAYPLAPLPRVAVLRAGFRPQSKIRIFPEFSREQLDRYRPEALAGPLSALRRLATHYPLPTVNRALVVFTTLDGQPLSDDDRDLFWRAWQVPVFEQLRDAQGALLAAECEAHDGLHVSQTSDLCHTPCFTLSSLPCPCGHASPRLVPLRDMIVSAPLQPEWRNWQTRRI